MNDYESFGILSGTCTGSSIEQFNHNFSLSSRKLFILNFNIQSFNAKVDEFLYFLDELIRSPDVIILTETWATDDSLAEIEGYAGFHCNRKIDRRGGGVSIFVKRELKANFVKISKFCG